jgi:hypothetical protein
MKQSTLDKLKIFEERFNVFHSKSVTKEEYWKKEKRILDRRKRLAEMESELVSMTIQEFRRTFFCNNRRIR